MEPEQLDSLEGMTTDQIKAAYEAGRLDYLLGRTVEGDPDPLAAALERKLTRRILTEPAEPTPTPRSGSAPVVALNSDGLEAALRSKLGIPRSTQ